MQKKIFRATELPELTKHSAENLFLQHVAFFDKINKLLVKEIDRFHRGFLSRPGMHCLSHHLRIDPH